MKFLRSALSRRAALGRLIGGAAAAPLLGPTLINADKAMAMHGAIAGANFGSSQPAAMPVQDPDWLIKKPIMDLLRRRETEANIKMVHRLGAFDADIASLNSVAYGQRVRMQIKRDAAARSVLDDLRQKLGWF